MNLNDLQLDALPEILRTDLPLERFLESATPEHLAKLGHTPEILAGLPKVWGCSPFIAKQCARQPALLHDLVTSGDLRASYAEGAQRERLDARVADAADETSVLRELRLWRRREMVRIAWRDLAGWADLGESLRDLSALADTAIDFVNEYYHAQLAARFGQPCDAEGDPQRLVILAMGKLGGRELNFSSDIDLIFTYPHSGDTQGGRKVLSNQEFFVRLGQKIVQGLDNITADGFVFRTDMRLRPFGDSGPLAMHFSSLEEYYQGNAREWERYALIKARPVGGGEAAETLMANLKPFVYRRYLDFGAFEALRDLKNQIDQEVRRKGHDDNIKLGLGGIREIEFICQAFQLIRGGRLRDLQVRHLLDTLTVMDTHELLPHEAIEQLRAAYRFLRLTENRLQAIDDRQTQRLPEDPLDRFRLAYAMGFDTWDAFLEILDGHRRNVHGYYREVIVGSEEPEENEQKSGTLDLVWGEHLHLDEQAAAALREAGFKAPEQALEALRDLHDCYSVRNLSRHGRQRLDALMPLLLDAIMQDPLCDVALQRILKLIEAVARRSVYLSLFIEHPSALGHLVRLCAESSWIACQLTRYPLLLDELLDPRRLYDPLKPAELDNAVQAQLAHLPMDDLEALMDTLRQFKRAQVLHIAASELTCSVNVEIASDHLTAIADCMLRQVLHIAWDEMVHKHGRPMCVENGESRSAHFAIAAYGKAGGVEMSYSSDIDVVFLHDSRGEQQFTDGAKSLDNNVFFARLAKRIMHLLTTPTSAGVLYEVDARLRPGGNSGLMVTSVEAFELYQNEEAWTWEHQALVRARAVAGDVECMERFEAIRRSVLQKNREDANLKKEVKDMRSKMRAHLDKSKSGQFDLKQGTGGIADIEFLVQYGVLRWAVDYPGLLDTTGMLPMLERFEDNGLFTAADVAVLSDGYRTYRTETHRLALQSENAVAPEEIFTDLRAQVRAIWENILGD